MSALTLTLRREPPQGVDCSPLVPEQLAGRSRSDIEAIELASGNRRVRVGELFEIRGDDADNIVIAAANDRLLGIGSGMKRGSIAVEGACGAYLGLGIRGGRIEVMGSVGAYTGSGMRAGLIEVRGDAGDFLGAARPGDRQGMRGGRIVVHGNAGDRVGDRMRRGLILIGGDAGAYCGARMLAGTIVVSGRVGYGPGYALKRGTLLLAHRPDEMPSTFQDSGEHALLFLTLLEKEMRREGKLFDAFLPLATRVRRFCGDLATGGTGEILIRV